MSLLLFRDQVTVDGFAVVPAVLNRDEIAALTSSVESLGENDSVRRRGGIFAVRNLLDVSRDVNRFANSAKVREIATAILGDAAFSVRGILFDKTPDANWKVPWHQDVTIAVAERHEVAGFGPWSMKAGVHHVQPPADILENMLSIRIHLDLCGEENGALTVLPGSHRLGRISELEASQLGAESEATFCTANAGDALLMKPLLVHASSPSSSPHHRRVIHLDFASSALPHPLCWLAEPR
jgi:ectoine hydroxylase-related dioxygenase (phytanoyl-CoA dioxygenase family)